MLLKALYDLAQVERLVPDPDFEVKPVAYQLRVAEDGRLLGVLSTKVAPPTEGKRKPTPRALPRNVPRESGRTSGDRAFFLFDKAEYVLGADPQGKRDPEKLRRRAGLFRERVAACAEATGDPAVGAVLRFLTDLGEGRQSVALPEDCAPNDLFAFVCAPDVDRLVTDRPAVAAWWREQRSVDDTGTDRCVVTGRPCTPADKHPPIKPVPGGTSSGVALVSFNASAFESYGWKSSANAPVSRGAAEACATALNRLLSPAPPDPKDPAQKLPRRNLRLPSDTVVCYWSDAPEPDDFLNIMPDLIEGNVEAVPALYSSLWQGRPPAGEDLSAFYALVLSGAQGRAVIRGWFRSTVADVQRHLAEYFADLALCRNTPTPRNRPAAAVLSLRTLLESLAPKGRSAQPPAGLEERLVRAALGGGPFPEQLVQRAVQRMRAEIGDTEWADALRRDAQAALIKAVLVRNHQLEVKETMDPESTRPGYLLGRLMAVLERLQQVAQGEVGASVVDRFFSNASAAPRNVFLRLLKQARKHAHKAKDAPRTAGAARWLDRQIDDIMSRFPAGPESLPAVLSIEEQGLFVIGYHQQRHALWQKREDTDRTPPEPEC